jgi:DNA polymerase-3 subunit epsilon
MYILFDTETTGLPKSWNAPVTDADNWPRMIQLAWAHCGEDGRKMAEHNYIIRPEGFEIPKEASDVHGITTERAMKEGVPLKYALRMFYWSLSEAKALVAHNISFDLAIVGAEYMRNDGEAGYEKLSAMEQVCTMLSSTNLCKIANSRGGYKWPKLIELHTKLFGEGFDGAHDALVDVNALVRCFFELRRLEILK